MPDSGNLRFIGLTKQQFLGVLVTLMVALVAVQGTELYRIDQLARDGSSAHGALCALKQDVQGRERSSQIFLLLTRAQREKRYGKALGDIPAPVIRQSLTSQQATLKSLSSLRC